MHMEVRNSQFPVSRLERSRLARRTLRVWKGGTSAAELACLDRVLARCLTPLAVRYATSFDGYKSYTAN